MGYLLISPLRKLLQNPKKIIAPFVHDGMTVVEIGPGMGFFTLEIAKKVGSSGKVIAIDIQPKMLEQLEQRAEKAKLRPRIETRLAPSDSLGMKDLGGAVDFVFAYAVVHELPDDRAFFKEVFGVLKPQATLFIAEPGHHVSVELFNEELQKAQAEGFEIVELGHSRQGYTALLRKGSGTDEPFQSQEAQNREEAQSSKDDKNGAGELRAGASRKRRHHKRLHE
jgi:ubiquinone/menaquinone biosynthesis C-methylase UbiE